MLNIIDVSFAFGFSNTTINVLGMKAVAAAAKEPRSHNNTKFALKETASTYTENKPEPQQMRLLPFSLDQYT